MTLPQVTAEKECSQAYDFTGLVLSLPERRDSRNPVWRRTQIAPCAILAQCSDCKQYLPITDFYVNQKKTAARKDILGQARASHCKTCSIKKYTEVDPRLKLLYAARNRAKLKGFECSLTIDDIVIPEYCPVLGIKLRATIGKGRRNLNELDHSPSLDRIDNNKGYVKGNVAVISFRANNIKKDANLQELKALVRYLEEFGPPDVADRLPFSTATTGGAR